MSHPAAARLAALAFLVLAIACDRDTDPLAASRAAPPASVVAADLVETCGSGGYVTRLIVDPSTTEAGDGRHFVRITDAIAAVRAGRIARGEMTVVDAACRITIDVAPGVYVGSPEPSNDIEVLPLVLDVPRLTLAGGLRMALDSRGRATGSAIDPGNVTVLQPVAPLGPSDALIIVTDSSSGLHGDGIDGTRGDSVTVRGFEFRSGHASPSAHPNGTGTAIFAMRAQGLVIEENRFGFLFFSAVDGRGATARLAHNSATDIGNNCAFCLSGPGSYEVSGSTLERAGLVGVLTAAAALAPTPAGLRPQTIPPNPSVIASIDNNRITGNHRQPVGTAIRVLAVGTAAASIPGQHTQVSVTGNDIVDNRFGLIADGGFPPLNTSPTLPNGHITLALAGNQFADNCQTNLLVAFARHTRALGLPTPAANAGYLKQSTHSITLGGDLPWSDVWFSHPAADNGVTLNNTLMVDGAPVGHGDRSAYTVAECGFTPSASAWIGLRNSDDVGTKFDLLTEVRRNGVLVASGQLDGVNGGSSGFNNAVERTISTALIGTPAPATGDVIAVTVSVRIAVGIPGHASGTARLWYGDASANSRVTTVVGTQSRTFYLASGFALADTPGVGPRKFIDVLVKKAGGNPFKPFGTWSRTF